MINCMRKSGIVLGISVVVFVVMQVAFGSGHCLDCGARVGFPFTYMQEGTFATLGHFIGLGFLGDSAVALAVSALAVWMWPRPRISK
jgi:hypothetical protein